MWHKPCRTFHPWCLCIKTRCLFSFDNMIFDTALATAFKSNQLWYRALRYIRYQNDGVIHRQYGNRCPTKIKPSTCEPGHYFRITPPPPPPPPPHTHTHTHTHTHHPTPTPPPVALSSCYWISLVHIKHFFKQEWVNSIQIFQPCTGYIPE